MHDGYDGPMNGTMRGFPLVRCPTHAVWHRSDKGCIACDLQRQVVQLQARLTGELENTNGNGGRR